MKNLFKKVAFVLALAMVLTNIAPAAAASAAVAPSLKYTTKVIYDGESMFSGYTNTCYTPSVNTTGYKVTYEVTTGKDLITVAANGKITATGDGIGKAVVTVTYTPEDGGKVTTAKFTVKVRRNATHTRLTKAVAAKFDEALAVGQEVVLQAAKSATTPASYAKGNYGLDNYMGVVSDQIAYKVSDDGIIKVTKNDAGKYVLTAAGAGEAVLTVYTYEYGDKDMVATREMEYKVTVAGGILDVNQMSVTTLKVSMGQEVEDAAASDFSVTRTGDTVDYGISSIEVSADKKTVTIETYSPMNDGEEYNVSYKEFNHAFTATDGTVADMKINKEVIPYNFASSIVVNLVDKNGIVLADVKESNAYENNVEWNWTTSNGSMYDDKLILYSKGSTAEITLTYRPGTYENGEEVGVIGPKTFKITAMDVAVDANILATIAGGEKDVCVYKWNDVAGSENRTIYVEDNRFLHILITDEFGNEITQNLFDDNGYYLESSNENILSVDVANAHNHTQWNGGHYIDDIGVFANISAVAAGNVNVLVKNFDNKVIFAINITVKPLRKFVGFEPTKTTLTLSNTSHTNDSGSIHLTARDQYGEATWINYLLDGKSDITVELQSAPNDSHDPYNGISMDWGNGLLRLSFSGQGLEKGNYKYKITFVRDNVTAVKYVTIVLQEAENNGSFSYKAVVGGNTDTAYFDNWNGADTRSTNIRVARYRGGVLYDYLDYDSTKATHISKIETTNGNYSMVSTISGSSVLAGEQTGSKGTGTVLDLMPDAAGDTYYYPVSTITGSVVNKAVTGTRNVTITLSVDGVDKLIKTSFTVNNSQEPMKAVVDYTTVRNTASTPIATMEDAIKAAITFIHDGSKEINDGAEANRIKVVEVYRNSTNSVSGDSVAESMYVKSIIIHYDRYNNGTYIVYEVPVGRAINVTNVSSGQ